MKCPLLYLVGQLGPGGLERQLCYLLAAMDRERYRPEVAVWNFSESDVYVLRIRELGVPLHFLAGIPSGSAKLLAFRRLVAKLNPQIVHSYTFYTNFAAWWATLGLRTIAVGSIRNNFTFDRQTSGKVLGRLSGRWPTVQICNSQTARETVEHSSSVFKPSRLHVVRNGLDIRNFKYDPCLPALPTLLAVGRLYPEKRWDRLLNVINSVAARKIQFIVRHAGNGPLLQELNAQAKRLRLDGTIEFLQFRNDSTFLIHTADDEGCPNVVMEAMACGRAVVATDAGDVPHLVEDGKTGFVVRRGDDEMLVERVITLITNRELCQKMGAAGRLKAEQEFGLDRLVSQTLAAYEAAGWRGLSMCGSTAAVSGCTK
jgi:glycosyltransferase involved in cell wall biosynthesis